MNLSIDFYSGYIPIVGTAVDVAFKVRIVYSTAPKASDRHALQANLANVALLESHLKKSKVGDASNTFSSQLVRLGNKEKMITSTTEFMSVAPFELGVY